MRKCFLLLAFGGCISTKLPTSLPDGNKIISSEDYIIWGQSALSWKDFKGPKRSNAYDGGTVGGISFAKDLNGKWKAFAYFDKTLSWHGKRQTGEGLIHEEYHFNIIEIFARRLRKDFFDKKLVVDSASRVNAFVKRIWGEVEAMQAQYDKETNHSKNGSQQKNWQVKIDSMLEISEQYKRIEIN